MTDVTTINNADALLVFRIGPVLCCAPALAIEAVIMPPIIHKPPGNDHNHPGVFRHTSGMVSVVDLRQRFGVDEKDRAAPGRMVVVEISGGHGGFLVDEIIDVMQWPQQGWGALPALVPREVFKRTLLLNNHIHLYADFEDLFKFRESGYLRAHIAALVEKHKQTGEKNKAPETPLTQAVSSQSPAELQITQPDPTKATSNTVVTETRPVQTPWTNTSPERRAATASHKKPESDLKPMPSATANLRRHDDVIPGLQIKIPAFIAPSIEMPATVNGNNKVSERNEKPPMEQHARVDAASGKLIIVALAIAMLAIISLVVTSFNKPEIKTADQPEPVTSQAEQTPDVVETKPDQDYQASITQDADGIVITIDTASEDLLKPQPANEPTNEKQPAASPIVAPTSAPEEKTIVHIVVKGDTLWAIANRYVRDPWRYPELAKLSNIKNPHRIYPGNRVKIIMRTAAKTEPVESRINSK
ncbi:MAG: hypothetical protein QG652_595 [Pseudomonadota bacterium]|nr:hypothetical protein [Pseudomonadota bacterium]